LTQTLTQTDRTVIRLSRLLSTPSGTDSTLCTLSYTLTLIHATLRTRLDTHLQTLAHSIATKASSALLPGETIIASFPPTSGLRRLASTTAAVKALAGLISDFRVFVRLWGLLGIYAWARATWSQPPGDGVVKAITWAQVVVNTLYQGLENGAYLASKGVLNSEGWTGERGAKRQARWWAWSSRFWAAHVGLEFVRLGYEWRRRVVDGVETGDAEKEGKLRKMEDARWWRESISNMAYAPLTIHWSMEEGVIGESVVGLLGMVAGGVNLRERWRQT
ncbi:hypothetical protein K490DRAFT_4699, partial [Saccharata proteae CBS 121410]